MKKYLLLLLIVSATSCSKEKLTPKCEELTVKEYTNTQYTVSDSMQIKLRAKGYTNTLAHLNVCLPEGDEDILILETYNSKTRAFLMLKSETLVEYYDKNGITRYIMLNNQTFIIDISRKKPCNKTTSNMQDCLQCSFNVLTNDIVGVIAYGLQPHVMTAAMIIHCRNK